MKRSVFIMLLLGLFACNNQKKSSETEPKEKSNLEYSASKASMQANQLLEEIKEYKLKNTSDFVPNEAQIKKYDLIKIENSYYLGALIKMNENASSSNLENLGVKIGTKAGNIWSAKIPVNNFIKLIQLNEVIYIDHNSTINTK